MQSIELLPIEAHKRREWILLLLSLAKKRDIEFPLRFSRQLESLIYNDRQKKIPIGDGINVCRYGELDILDLDFIHAHETAAALAYTNSLRRMAWALESGNLISKHDPMLWLLASDEQLIEGTLHAEWERAFYARKELARDVLNGKSDVKNKVGIFACPRCKSFDVDTEQKQTRSSDEPMTIFCTCNMCEKRFVR
jgi:DNA-directed RNA polymerase subunit M/transcription elongation factor TFIIS